MYKEKELLRINPNSDAIKFIIQRMNSNNVHLRGHHVMQHSRTNIEQYDSMLRILFSHEKKLLIPKGDEYNAINNPDGFQMGDYPVYNELIIEVSKLNFYSKSSPNAFKKIVLNDMHRLGLIEKIKITPKGERIYCKLFERCSAQEVKVTATGINFLNETNIILKKNIISEMFKKNISQISTILIELFLYEGIKTISIEEFALFVSWVNFSDDNFTVSKCAKILLDFKSITRNQRESVVHFFKTNQKSSDSKGSKKYWDWHNWKNEPQSIFNLLKDSNLFNLSSKSELTFNIPNGKSGKFKRDPLQKKRYNDINSISKKLTGVITGFEYHHIVPMAWINEPDDYKFVDNHMNLLYISGTAHNKIPKKSNGMVNLTRENNKIILSDLGETSRLELEIGIDVLVDEVLVEQIIKYNNDLLSTLK